MIIDLLNKLEVTSDIVIKLTSIYKNIGKQELYENEISEDIKLKTLFTAEKNAFYLIKLLEINIPDSRLEHILTNRTDKLKNRSEETAINLLKVFIQIYHNPKNFTLYNTTIQNLVEQTYGVQFGHKFKEIRRDKVAINKKVEEYNNMESADKILTVVRENVRKQTYEELLLAIIAYVDYNNVDLFQNKHKITSLLVLFIMLCQLDIKVLKYESFFEYIYENYQEFSSALLDVSLYKEEDMVKPLSMQRFMLDMIDEMYERFEVYVKERKFDKTFNKTQNIVITIFKLPEVFKKSDIKRHLPGVSEVTINKTLQVLQQREVIKPMGKGRGAQWLRLMSNSQGIDFSEISDYKLSDLTKKDRD